MKRLLCRLFGHHWRVRWIDAGAFLANGAAIQFRDCWRAKCRWCGECRVLQDGDRSEDDALIRWKVSA